MIEIKVDVRDDASDELAAFVRALSGSQMTELNEVAGRTAANEARDYHREFDARGGWRGPRSRGHGPTKYGEDVATRWIFQSASPTGAVISNATPHFAFKVSGGTIRPKRVKFLTIPLTAEAKDLTVRTYEQTTGRKLFRPKGKHALMERGPDGKARSVYALVKEVTQRPWPGALPPDDRIAGAFSSGFRAALADLIESL